MASVITNALRFPRIALRHHELLGAFVRRDLQARYAGSLLGKLWPVLQPLLLLGVFSLVFAGILQIPFHREGVPTAVGRGWVTVFFLLAGILPWQCTVESISRCTGIVAENANLIKKVAFPSELLPTYATMVAFVQMLIGFGLFIPLYVFVVLVTPGDPIGERVARVAHVAWLPATVLLQFVFVTGLGMLLSAINVFVRDVGHVIPLALQLWMFFSPIWYRIDAIERNVAAWLVTAMKLNPMYHLMALYRGCFPYEKGASFPLDSLWKFALVAFGFFLLGHGCFHRWKGHFADEV